MTNGECHVCGLNFDMKNPLLTKPTGGARGKPPAKGGAAPKGGSSSPKAKASDPLCLCCGNAGHLKSECRSKDKECSNCGKTGHLAKVCKGGNQSAAPPAAGRGGKNGQRQASKAVTRQELEAMAASFGCVVSADPAAPAAAQPDAELPTLSTCVDTAADMEESQQDYAKAKKHQYHLETQLEKAKENCADKSLIMLKKEALHKKTLAETNQRVNPSPPPQQAEFALHLPMILAAAQAGGGASGAKLKMFTGNVFKNLNPDDLEEKAMADRYNDDLMELLVRTVGTAYTELLQKFEAGNRDMDDTRAKRLRTAVGGVSVGGTAADAPSSTTAADSVAKAAQLAQEQRDEEKRAADAATAKEEREAAEAAVAEAAKKKIHEERMDKIDKDARAAALEKLARETPTSDGEEDLGASLSLEQSLLNQAAANKAKADKAWKFVGKPAKATPAAGSASRRAASAAPRSAASKG